MSPRSELQASLLAWYDANKRTLPWRATTDPYAIWVSEAMAQQTSVGVAAPYWLRWMARFPNVQALAAASEDEVLTLWQGLGYYRRAKSLLMGARAMAKEGVPTTLDSWREVPGVGPYTAAAVASIALGVPSAAVDGNVERVYARLAEDHSIGGPLKRNASAWAADVLVRERPGDWNQAVMELGALVCTPRNPNCVSCPISGICKARANGIQALLPGRPVVKEVLQLSWHCHLITDGVAWAVERIEDGGWWRGMWRFPTNLEPRQAGKVVGNVKHTVTHHRIVMDIYQQVVSERQLGFEWADPPAVEALALPALYRKAWAVRVEPRPPAAQEA